MGGSGHWLRMEQVAWLRHAEDQAAAERRRRLRAARGPKRAPGAVWVRRVLARAGTTISRLLVRRQRPADVPVSIETAAPPPAVVLLD